MSYPYATQYSIADPGVRAGIFKSRQLRWTIAFAVAALVHAIPFVLKLDGPRGIAGDNETSLTVSLEDNAPLLSENGEYRARTNARLIGSPLSQTDFGNIRGDSPHGIVQPSLGSPSLPDTVVIEHRRSPAREVRSSVMSDADDPPLTAKTDDDEYLVGYAYGTQKRGPGNALERALSVPVASAQDRTPTLRIPGRPIYPKACRDGLCRQGRPCEGVSVWKVSVPADGGVPFNIECIQSMECELQNASIRKFFSTVSFPGSTRVMTYLFTVPMTMSATANVGSHGEEP